MFLVSLTDDPAENEQDEPEIAALAVTNADTVSEAGEIAVSLQTHKGKGAWATGTMYS